MATQADIHEANSSLSPLVERASDGEDILIAKNGKPVARLTRLSRGPRTLVGAFKGRIHMADDFDAIPADLDPFL